MNLTKVKIKGTETEIHYKDSAEKDTKETVFKSTEKQSPEFFGCLQSLKPYLLRVLELPDDYGNALKITGLTVKYEDTDVEPECGWGCVISGVRDLEESSAPFCLNTPYIPPMRNEDTNTIMSKELIKVIEEIFQLCTEFVRGGQRAQGELFEGK